METRTLEIALPEAMWRRIDRLVEADSGSESVAGFVAKLLDHVQQGVYRSGAWERSWLIQCVGPDAVEDAYQLDDDPL